MKGDDFIYINLPVWVLPKNSFFSNLSGKKLMRQLKSDEKSLIKGKENKAFDNIKSYVSYTLPFPGLSAVNEKFEHIKYGGYSSPHNIFNLSGSSSENLEKIQRNFFYGGKKNISSINKSEAKNLPLYFNRYLSENKSKNLSYLNKAYSYHKAEEKTSALYEKGLPSFIKNADIVSKKTDRYENFSTLNKSLSEKKSRSKSLLLQNRILNSSLFKENADIPFSKNFNESEKAKNEKISLKEKLLEKNEAHEKAKSFPVQVSVNMGGVSQNISSKSDADYFIDKLASELTEAFTSSAQGVYE